MLEVISNGSLCGSCNGACCRHVGRPPSDYSPGWPEAGNWQWFDDLPEHLQAEVLQRLSDDPEDEQTPCLWILPDGRCREYENRPIVCRLFEPGSEDCLEFRRDAGIA